MYDHALCCALQNHPVYIGLHAKRAVSLVIAYGPNLSQGFVLVNILYFITPKGYVLIPMNQHFVVTMIFKLHIQ